MRTFDIKNDKETRYLLDNEMIDYTIVDNDTVIRLQYDSTQDLWDLCEMLAKEKYREKPEEFWLPDEYIPVLKNAMRLWSKETYMSVDSIRFSKEEQPDSNVTKVIVSPTTGHALFGIYSNYGKLVHKVPELKEFLTKFNEELKKGADTTSSYGMTYHILWGDEGKHIGQIIDEFIKEL